MNIVFKNKGLIDIKAITTFGISSKENDTAIGYFGTGLKYAIAILLREGCDITIYSGENIYSFTLETKQVRVNSFNFVQMNGEDLAFTTELGKNWELWQAYRELYCNCIDENGNVSKAKTNEVAHDINETTIVVKGSAFAEIHCNNEKIILSSKPLAIIGDLEIHPGNSEFLFYKGIKIYKLPKPSYYTYNLLFNCKLTEDRTLFDFWTVRYTIIKYIFQLADVKIIDKIIKSSKEYFEKDLDFDYSLLTMSETFLDYAKKCIKDRCVNLNFSLRKLILSKTNLEEEMYELFELNIIQQKVLNKATNFCIQLGYNVDEYPIVCVKDLGNNNLGLARNETIYLSELVFIMGSKQVTSCLLEEYIHLKRRLYDETRELQNYLFDTIISLGELLLNKDL